MTDRRPRPPRDSTMTREHAPAASVASTQPASLVAATQPLGRRMAAARRRTRASSPPPQPASSRSAGTPASTHSSQSPAAALSKAMASHCCASGVILRKKNQLDASRANIANAALWCVCWLYARRERRYTRRCTPQSEFLLQKNTCTEQTSSHNSLSPQTEIRACCTRDAAGPYPTPTLHAQGRWTVYTQPTPGASPLCHAPRARSLRHGPPQRARHMSVIT